MIKPRKLNPGDTIAIISPSSPTKDPTAVPRGKEYLESLGYKVVKLDRVQFAGLTKKNVRRGDWRYLTEEEVDRLRMGAYE